MAPNKKSKTSKRKSNKTLFIAIGIIAIILVGIGAYAMMGQSSNQPANVTPTPSLTPAPNTSSMPSPTTSDPLYSNPTKVLLQTNVGNISLELRSDKPITTNNFETLVREGKYGIPSSYRGLHDSRRCN